MEVGPTMAGGFGAAPLSFTELCKWADATGREPQPWEMSLLRRLSGDYVVEAAEATDPDRFAPYAAAPTQRDREAVSRGLRLQLKALAQAQAQPPRKPS